MIKACYLETLIDFKVNKTLKELLEIAQGEIQSNVYDETSNQLVYDVFKTLKAAVEDKTTSIIKDLYSVLTKKQISELYTETFPKHLIFIPDTLLDEQKLELLKETHQVMRVTDYET